MQIWKSYVNLPVKEEAVIEGIKGRIYIVYIQFTLFWLWRITRFCTVLLEPMVHNFITYYWNHCTPVSFLDITGVHNTLTDEKKIQSNLWDVSRQETTSLSWNQLPESSWKLWDRGFWFYFSLAPNTKIIGKTKINVCSENNFESQEQKNHLYSKVCLCHTVTETWNGLDWMGPSKIIFPPPSAMSRDIQVDQVSQSHIQPGLECLQQWGIHHFSG